MPKVISQAQLSRKLMKCVPWQAKEKKINQVFQRNSQNFQSKIPFWLKEGTKIGTLIKKKWGRLSVVQLWQICSVRSLLVVMKEMVQVKGVIKGSRTKDLQNAHSQHDNTGNLKERPSCRQDKSLFLKVSGPDEYVKI